MMTSTKNKTFSNTNTKHTNKKDDATVGNVMPADKFAVLQSLVIKKASDGNVSDDDLEKIATQVEKYEETYGVLSDKQKDNLSSLARKTAAQNYNRTTPMWLRIAGGITIGYNAITIVLAVPILLEILKAIPQGLFEDYSTSEIALMIAFECLEVISVILSFVLGIRLILNKRGGAANIASILFYLTCIEIAVNIMFEGVSFDLIYLGAVAGIQIGLSCYLNPSLSKERKLRRRLKTIDSKVRAKTGTLGLSLENNSYIELDFFNLFWIFIAGCIIGLVVEDIFHIVVIEPGVYQDRAGLLWGPFSPIYGFGAAIMTVILNRFKNGNAVIIFVACTVIGGAFEYIVSYWMEIGFGAKAWDYSTQFLNIQGRTCLLYAAMFGLIGLVWIKALLPLLLKLVNKIPWKIRYSFTTVCAALMLVNCVMTVQSLDCWYERVSGKPVATEIQQFYATNFGDQIMQHRFQSMTINPNNAARQK